MNSFKVHVALNVSDVEKSVDFYRAAFGAEPVKHKPGYAKFDIADPPLNLTLNHARGMAGPGALNHLGIQVSSTLDVLAAKRRLQEAGLMPLEEMNTDCCYAMQDKVWVSDPDGNRWEVFVVKEADTRPDLEISGEARGAGLPPAACCAPPAVRLEK